MELWRRQKGIFSSYCQLAKSALLCDWPLGIDPHGTEYSHTDVYGSVSILKVWVT